MTLLTIVQDAADVIGLPRPSSVIGSTDQQVRTLLALANREGKELAKRGDGWQALVKEASWTSLAASLQGTIASIISDGDFNGRVLHDTIWNRDTDEPLYGIGSVKWQRYQATTSPLVYAGWRIWRKSIYVLPAPSAGQTFAFEYVSKFWCESSDAATQRAAWAADADTGLLDEELMTLGLIWRFRQAKGLDYAEDMATYERQVADAMGRDGVKPTLYAGTGSEARSTVAVPEGSWNLS